MGRGGGESGGGGGGGGECVVWWHHKGRGGMRGKAGGGEGWALGIEDEGRKNEDNEDEKGRVEKCETGSGRRLRNSDNSDN